MERWLSHKIADKYGVCMNVAFPFPKKVLRNSLEQIFPELHPHGEWSFPDSSTATWQMFLEIKKWIQSDPTTFAPVANYLNNDFQHLKCFQFCSRLINVFDQYDAYRPNMIQQWIQGSHSETHGTPLWQFTLWNELFNKNSGWKSLNHLLLELDHRDTSSLDFPHPLCFFGISSMPQTHLLYFNRLSETLPIEIYLPYPSVSPKLDDNKTLRQIKFYELKARFTEGEEFSPNDTFMTVGNSLATALGEQSAEFLNQLISLNTADEPLFNRTSNDSCLHLLQGILQDMTEPTAEHSFNASDTSVQFHSCHSPAREAEVLREYLIHQFEQSAANGQPLDPADVIIMVPDMARYGPCIQGVLSNTKPFLIPFTVADQGVRTENSYANLILHIFEMAKGRFTAEELIAFFDLEPVSARLDLPPESANSAKKILRDSQFHWGRDADHCRQFSHADVSRYSWQSARERIAWGLCMMPNTDRPELFDGVLPLNLEGDRAKIALQLLGMTDALATTVKRIQQENTFTTWADILQFCLDTFAPTNDVDSDSLTPFTSAIEQLNALAKSFPQLAISGNVMTEFLSGIFNETHVGKGFLNGKITVCEMRPMRSIPTKIVCLLGINDGDFPRPDIWLSFNAINQKPLPGDRSVRKEDRNLFLEAIMSARQAIFISWIGKSVRDNSKKSPSPVVTELRETIKELYPDGDGILKKITFEHKLHAFDPEYFMPKSASEKHPLPQSYSTDQLALARHLSNGDNLKENTSAPLNAITEPPSLSTKQILTSDLPVKSLLRFFENPCLAFHDITLKAKRLFPNPNEILDHELILMDNLDNYALRASITKKTTAVFPEVLRQQGLLPAGVEGEWTFHKQHTDVEQFNRLCNSIFGNEPPAQMDITTELDGFVITAHVTRAADRILYARMAKVKPKDRINLWIHHLIATLSAPDAQLRTCAVFLDVVIEHPVLPQQTARSLLSALLAIFREGLQKPIPFFPSTAFTFTETLLEKSLKEEPDVAHQSALNSAKGTWISNHFASSPESECFPYADFFDIHTVLENTEFAHYAHAFFAPLITHTEERENA